jgi:hypothetical protein
VPLRCCEVRQPTVRSTGDAVGGVEEDLLQRARQVAAPAAPVLSLSGGVFMIDARASEQLSPLDQGCLRETAAAIG